MPKLQAFFPKHADNFLPLPYPPENHDIPAQTPPPDPDASRALAVSRSYLDNLAHITAYGVGLGMKLAQVALSYGANALQATITTIPEVWRGRKT